jgi:threonine dehydrogenase-like Zn-dependent dehydrogenase
MQALAIDAGGHLVLEERDLPSPKEGEVLVSVEACGLCGSDLSMLAAGPAVAGRVLGHEIAGAIVETPGGEPSLPRKRVAVLPAPRCDMVGEGRRCRQCEEDKSHLCAMQGPRTLGLTVDGGFAEYVTVISGQCFAVGDRVDPEIAALVEPLAVALHAIDKAALKDAPNGDVLVLGAGPIGLLVTLALRLRGIDVIAVERSSFRRSLASRIGAGAVAASWKELNTRRRYTTVFECTGTAEALEAAAGLVASGGTVVLVGAPKPDQYYRLHGLSMLVREVNLRPAMAYTNEEFVCAAEELTRSADAYSAVITHSIPLDKAAVELPRLIENGEYGKVIVIPTGR